MSDFCAICIDGTEGLMRADDGKLECHRCRGEHPIHGGYSFDGGRCDRSIGDGNSRRSSSVKQRSGKLRSP